MNSSIGIGPAGGGVATPLPPQLQHTLNTIQQLYTHTLNTITQLLKPHLLQTPTPTPPPSKFHTIYAPRARLLVPLSSPWFGHEDDLLCALGLGREKKRKEEGDRNYDDRNLERYYGDRNYRNPVDWASQEVCGVTHTTLQPNKQTTTQLTIRQQQQRQPQTQQTTT